MRRRQWLTLAGRAGCTALLPACAGSSVPSPGIDLAALERAGGDGHGVWQSGRLLAGQALTKRLPSLSITKAVAALATLSAAAEGWLAFDESLTGDIPEWRQDPAKAKITVRMLVNQSAGFPSGVAGLYRGRIPDKGRVAVALPLVDEPGRQFRYGPASSEVLAELLRRKLARRGTNPEAFLARLMRRIGISSPNWRKDASGSSYFSTGAEFSVHDLGQLGQLVCRLANGRDDAGIQAAAFLDLSSPRPANPMFSAGIWWNRNAARADARSIEPERHLDDPLPPAFWQSACLAAGLDPAWLALVGSGGKRVYVLPALDLVIARLGRSRHWNDAAFLRSITQV
jgi:CubicO group peptidase (beta-lactamase class C family)